MTGPEPIRPRAIPKAVFPVAGLGTRFLPATKAVPKELLPIVDWPLIQYAVDEAREAGIEQMIFVTGRGKTAIMEHFDRAFELEAPMTERGKDMSVLEGDYVLYSNHTKRPFLHLTNQLSMLPWTTSIKPNWS